MQPSRLQAALSELKDKGWRGDRVGPLVPGWEDARDNECSPHQWGAPSGAGRGGGRSRGEDALWRTEGNTTEESWKKTKAFMQIFRSPLCFNQSSNLHLEEV